MKSRKRRKIFSIILSAAVVITALPALPAYAVQDTGYRDPLDHWVESADRTNELDINAVVTNETGYCKECDTQTMFRAFRTPEYSKDGVSAAERGVVYSDGTMADGSSAGVIRNGSVYTGYHWTKSVCTKCGGLNTNCDYNLYGYGKNVYILYDCSQRFIKPLDSEQTYESQDGQYHLVKESGGSYCALCYGTVHTSQERLEKHSFKRIVETEPANKRFKVTDRCKMCGYEKVSYIAAGAVAENYTGKADGKDHSITINDFSDDGVDVKVLYGTEYGRYTLENAPSYRKSGRYPVYYEITYSFGGSTMKEEGAAYVILAGGSQSGSGGGCSCGNEDCCCGEDCDGSDCSDCQQHVYKFSETVDATCSCGGYDKYICIRCGKTEERNVTDSLPHQWEKTVIQKSDCTHEGKYILICASCGRSKIVTEPEGEHKFEKHTVKATCIRPGYTVSECTVCGEKYINDITDALPHKYEEHVSEASCLTGGHINHVCSGCGSSFITDYKDPLGHHFDKGTKITDSTCSAEGVVQYECTRCGYKYLSAEKAEGHTPGKEATCTTPQICEKCGAVLSEAAGHKFEKEVREPSCGEMGCTVYKCTVCGYSYCADFVKPAGHKAGEWIIDVQPDSDSEGSRHKECEVCGEVLEKETIEKTGAAESGAVTGEDGRAVIGSYLIIVTDTDSGAFVSGARVSLSGAAVRIVLPDDRKLDYSNQTTVTVLTSDEGNPVSGLRIDVADTSYNRESGTTDSRGQITVPAGSDETSVMESHMRYIYGYPDGTFRPDGNMTRSEAAAIFARLLAYSRNEKITAPQPGSRIFADVASSDWYAGDLYYLMRYGVISGDGSGMFRPDDEITRAELTAMAARFFDVCPSAAADSGSGITENSFSDVGDEYWADPYIDEAYSYGWISGYGDGTFRGDNPITRAEMVTITNNLLGRTPDSSYIKKNVRNINMFSDLSSSHWAFGHIMEASANHRSEMTSSTEYWVKIAR